MVRIIIRITNAVRIRIRIRGTSKFTSYYISGKFSTIIGVFKLFNDNTVKVNLFNIINIIGYQDQRSY